MLSLDLFDSKFEKKLHEGALDDTITRTQAHLMEPLSQRAADIRTQIRSGKLSGADLDKLEKEYEDLVQQRQDIIFKRKTKTQEQQVPSKQDPFAYVKPEPKGIPGNVPTKKIPGKDELLKGRGRTYYENQKKNTEQVDEHGGGIGPRQHWQDLMQEGQPLELMNRYLSIDADNDVDAVKQAIQTISKDPNVSEASKARLLGQLGMIIRRHRLPIGRDYYQFMQQYMEEQSVTETVVDVKAGMAEIYRRLAPKIERHRDSFLAGQLYDELENYAELHGAEGEFKRMMNGARNRAHMEYDTNPGGFHNWFWFLPFEDNDVDEAISKKDLLAKLQKNLPKVNDPKNKHAKPVNWTGPGKDDYGYTGYQGHGMPTDKQERARIRADKKKGAAEGTDDIKKRMSKLEALALAANRAGDDAKCKRYQQKIQSLKQKLSQSMSEGAKPGEYYIHTVYFKDGTKKRIRVTSDEFDVADYYTKRGQAVDRVDYDFQLQSDMTEGLKSTLAGAALAGAMALGGAGAAQAQSASSGPNIVNATTIIQQIQAGKIQNQNDLSAALGNASNKQAVFKILQNKAGLPGHGADSVINAIANKSPAGAQQPTAGAQQPAKSAGQSGVIIQRPTDNFEGRIKEDQDTSGVEQAILKRIMVAHTDLLMKFGPEKVMQAAEEVAYNVGDVDEIGTSDVSAYVAQVKQILGATP